MWKNKLKFTFYVRFCMKITLSYSCLLILLLILINFLFPFLSFNLTSPHINFWLRHWRRPMCSGSERGSWTFVILGFVGPKKQKDDALKILKKAIEIPSLEAIGGNQWGAKSWIIQSGSEFSKSWDKGCWRPSCAILR